MRVFMCLSCAAYVCVGVCLTLSYYVCACACVRVCVCVWGRDTENVFVNICTLYSCISFTSPTYRELLKSKYPLKRLFFSLSFSLYFCESSHCSPSASIPCTFAHRLPFSDLDQLITVYVAAHLRQLQINLSHKRRKKPFSMSNNWTDDLFSGSALRWKLIQRGRQWRHLHMKPQTGRWSCLPAGQESASISASNQISSQPNRRPLWASRFQSRVHHSSRVMWTERTELRNQGSGSTMGRLSRDSAFHWRPLCSPLNCPVEKHGAKPAGGLLLCVTATVMFIKQNRDQMLPVNSSEGLLFWKGSIVYIVFLCSHFLCCQASGWWMSTTRTFA